jgi:hypothetical protein
VDKGAFSSNLKHSFKQSNGGEQKDFIDFIHTKKIFDKSFNEIWTLKGESPLDKSQI